MASLPARAARKISTDGPLAFSRASADVLTARVRGHYQYYGRKLRARFDPARADPWRPIVVDPTDVVWTLKAEPSHGADDVARFHHRRDAGRIVGGDWDRRPRVRFEEMPKFRAVRRHFRDGVPWEETDVFADLAEAIERHGRFDGCENVADLRERYREIDRLYDRISREGYKSRCELCRPWEIRCRLDLPTVHVGRDGALISAQGGGYHRLSIGRLLDVPVEVRVVVRHRRWQEHRDAFARADSIADLPPERRSHADHPDLRDLID